MPFVEKAVVLIIGGNAEWLDEELSLLSSRISVDLDGMQLHSWKTERRKDATMRYGILDRRIPCQC